MFHGSLVALVTPMQANGELDLYSLRYLVDWHISQHTHAIIVIGTTGEAATLSPEEQALVIKATVEQAKGRLPVIAGTGTHCTKTTIERTRSAMELGVDACLLVTPYYNGPTQEGLYQHYRSIAEAVPVPQILYNIPRRTACDLDPETVVRLAKIPNIIGLKEGSVTRACKILEQCGPDLDVFSGEDQNTLSMIRQGGKGVISVCANLLPQRMHNLCQAALQGELETAQRIDETLRSLYRDLFLESNPIPVKWAMAHLGMIPEGIRLPLTPLSVAKQGLLLHTLESLGLMPGAH